MAEKNEIKVTPTSVVAEAIKLVASRNGRPREDYWDLLEAADVLSNRVQRLEAAVRETIESNAHLADGDVCTLGLLRDVFREHE